MHAVVAQRDIIPESCGLLQKFFLFLPQLVSFLFLPFCTVEINIFSLTHLLDARQILQWIHAVSHLLVHRVFLHGQWKQRYRFFFPNKIEKCAFFVTHTSPPHSISLSNLSKLWHQSLILRISLHEALPFTFHCSSSYLVVLIHLPVYFHSWSIFSVDESC